MKFGEYLLENSIPAWSTQYLDYNKLKSILRELKEFNDKTNCSSSTSPIIHTPHRGNNNKSDTCRASPNTLSVLRPISISVHPSSHSTTNLGSVKRNNNNDNKEAVDLVTNSVKFDFEYLMPIIQSSISTHFNDVNIQKEVLEIEKRFIFELEKEMNKVSAFYCQQSVYFAQQAETLLARLRLMVNLKPKRNITSNLTTKSMSHVERTKSRKKSIKEIESELFKHFETNQLKIKIPNNGSIRSRSKSQSMSVSDIKLDQKREKKELQKLFRVTYHAIVHKLSSYRLLNVTAIQKICKKHDKNSSFKHIKTEMGGIIDSESNFGDNYFEQYLIERLEHAYGQFLASPNHRKKCEAIQELKALGSIPERHFIKPYVDMEQKRKRQERQNDSCKIGFYSGASFSMLIICSLLIFIGKSTNLSSIAEPLYKNIMDSAETYRAFYLHRATILVCLYLWLFGYNLHIWQKNRFNHPFIFEADPSTVLKSHHVFLQAGFLTCITGLIGTLYLLEFMFDQIIIKIPLWIFQMVLALFWITYFIFPGKRLLSTRKYLLSSFWRQIRAPFSSVHFVDFFIADQWCSLFTVIVDITFSMCFFVKLSLFVILCAENVHICICI